MPRKVRSRRRKTQQGFVQSIGIEAMRDLDEWSRIINEWNGECAYCGCRPKRGEKLTKDHVVSIAKGGEGGPKNVVPACKQCNDKKGTQTWVPLVKPGERTVTERTPSKPNLQHVPIPAPRRRLHRPTSKVPGAGLSVMKDALKGI